MNNLMSFVSELTETGDVKTILYLGVQIVDPTPFLNLNVAHVAMAIPAPLLPGAFAKQDKRDAQLSLHPVLAGETDGESEIVLYNSSALSSCHPPADALRKLFPNLREKRRITVETRSLTTLLAALSGSERRRDMLVVDLRGGEQALLDALRDLPPQERFGHIVLRAGEEPLYANALSLSRIAEELFEMGYEARRRNLDDPDIPCVHFHLDRIAVVEFDLARLLESQGGGNSGINEQLAALAADRGSMNLHEAHLGRGNQYAIDDALRQADVQISILRDLFEIGDSSSGAS